MGAIIPHPPLCCLKERAETLFKGVILQHPPLSRTKKRAQRGVEGGRGSRKMPQYISALQSRQGVV